MLYATITDVLLNEKSIHQSVIKLENLNVDVIPSTIELAHIELKLNSEDKEYMLSYKLNEIKDDYDYIFIDCPPSLGLLTVKLVVVLACGSKSTNKTFLPNMPRAAERFTLVVVLPTPPFWFEIAMIFPMCNSLFIMVFS